MHLFVVTFFNRNIFLPKLGKTGMFGGKMSPIKISMRTYLCERVKGVRRGVVLRRLQSITITLTESFLSEKFEFLQNSPIFSNLEK